MPGLEPPIIQSVVQRYTAELCRILVVITVPFLNKYFTFHSTRLGIHTVLHIPWCRILLEKLIVTQLVKKYPSFLWKTKVHFRFHTSPPLDPVLSQLNPVRPIDPYLSKVMSFFHCLDRAKESIQVRSVLKHFVTITNFYGEGLLDPRPTPNLEDHPLSAVHDCLFNIFAATLRTRTTYFHPQHEDAPWRSDKGPN
jgi:hypothetical protein